MLSCSCDYDYDPDPGQFEYWPLPLTLEFKPLNTSRAKRCCSCGKLIKIGDVSVSYKRYRHPYTEIEAKIHGIDWEFLEEPVIKMADHYHCEWCGEMYQNFLDLGFECLRPDEDMRATLKEYKELYMS